ncbi:hypothetical protein, partial [Novosphingobium colocasiae]|uniref:hypothetical protein n=1 Tax=Novosphingobium colocasiae TaxID=1256513 RepID=UPI001E50C0C3
SKAEASIRLKSEGLLLTWDTKRRGAFAIFRVGPMPVLIAVIAMECYPNYLIETTSVISM